jgi:hypothetical protein
VLGEHGDSEVLHWSGAAAGNLSVAEVARQMGRQLTDADRSLIDTAVRGADGEPDLAAFDSASSSRPRTRLEETATLRGVSAAVRFLRVAVGDVTDRVRPAP